MSNVFDTNPRAWTAHTIDSPANWHYPSPDAVLAACPREPPTPITAFTPDDALRAACSESLKPVRNALSSGAGSRSSTRRRRFRICRCCIGWSGMGSGGRWRRTCNAPCFTTCATPGRTCRRVARFSVTNYESSFHTDNSFGDALADFVGLLCLQSAKSGGRSQLISGYALYDHLLAHRADVVPILCEPFHVDRRGGVLPGESATARFPVIGRHGGELVFRYLRYWIEAGHEKAGQPLTAEQTRALNVLDECMRLEELRVEFDLKPGQMFFVNNRWLLHNRTAFEDHLDPERRRHLLRLWLRSA